MALLLIISGAWQAGLFDRWLEPSPPAPEPTPAPAPTPTPEPAPAPAPAHNWRAELLDYVTNTPDPSGDRLFGLGQGAAEAGDQETALLAFEEAMKRGSGPALRAVGRWYDPAYYTSQGSPFSKPNPEQAARYYKRALEAGVADAGTDLKTVCASAGAEPWVREVCPR